jgi:hypothetical protein
VIRITRPTAFLQCPKLATLRNEIWPMQGFCQRVPRVWNLSRVPFHTLEKSRRFFSCTKFSISKKKGIQSVHTVFFYIWDQHAPQKNIMEPVS